MHDGDFFTSVQELLSGELTIKVGDWNMRFLYSGASISLNTETDIGAVEFDIYDMAVTRNQEPATTSETTPVEEMLETLAKHLHDDTRYRGEMRRRLFAHKPRFLYSRTEEGHDVLTLYNPFPVETENKKYSISEIAGMTVCTLTSTKEPICPNMMYFMHCDAIGGRKLVEDRFALGKEMISIADKVNEVFAELEFFLTPEDFEDTTN